MTTKPFTIASIQSHLLMLIVTLLMSSISMQVDAFGARRQYHSYHHISQKKETSRSLRRNIGKTYSPNDDVDSSTKSNNISSPSTTAAMSLIETELLLERAAHIRELNARRRGEVVLTSAST